MVVHRLMIVDDDEILRKGIEKTAGWAENGIQVVGTARNGRECLKMIPDCLPQIILTDIRMPFMDGIQLCEAVYNLYPDIRLVLLTAYDDFSYAKKALEYKVTEYVMKYENTDTIVSAVQKAAAEYDRQKNNAVIIHSSVRLLKNKFLKDWALEPHREEEIRHTANKLGMSFSYDGFQILSFNLTPVKDDSAAVGIWRMEQYQEQFGNLLADCLSNEKQKVYYFISEDHLSVLLNTDTEISDQELLPVLKSLEDVLKISIVAGAGWKYNRCEDVPKTYHEAMQALEYQNVMHLKLESSKVIHFNEAIESGDIKDDIISKIIFFIQKHYFEKSLSLNMIADAVHLTPTYVSAIFKKDFGTNITDYLTEIRMNKARELLSKTSMKTYEISERVGYSNSQYFSVLFKRTTEMSPTEYRQKTLKKAAL